MRLKLFGSLGHNGLQFNQLFKGLEILDFPQGLELLLDLMCLCTPIDWSLWDLGFSQRLFIWPQRVSKRSKSWLITWSSSALDLSLLKVYESFGFPKVFCLAAKVFKWYFQNLREYAPHNPLDAHMKLLVFEWGALGTSSALLCRFQYLEIS